MDGRRGKLPLFYRDSGGVYEVIVEWVEVVNGGFAMPRKRKGGKQSKKLNKQDHATVAAAATSAASPGKRKPGSKKGKHQGQAGSPGSASGAT